MIVVSTLLLLVSPVLAAGPFVFSGFRGNGDGLHLAYSEDGRDWTALDKVFLKPAVGSKLMRDPNLLQDADGLFHLVWTTGWGDTGIGYATSRDLIHWSEQRYLPLMEKIVGTKTCWAPELTYDAAGGQFVIVWSSNVVTNGTGQLRAYYSTTTDFKTFAEPKMLFNPGFDNLDTTLVKTAAGYVAVFKQADDQPKKVWGPVWTATAPAVLGPYTVAPKPAVQNKRVEGPACVTLGDMTLVYADYYVDGRYGAWATRDFSTWTDVSNTVAVVSGQRHGSIVPVPVAVLAELRKPEAAKVASVPVPILDGFTADPSIRVFGDRYYVYPTSDKPNWNTTDFSVWSSRDLIDWKREGMILDVTRELSWANSRAWAPDCVGRNGKYYFYFCADAKIGVAVADKPTGPFKDAIGRPLIRKGGKFDVSQTIDPQAFVDDDGQAYLYYGNGRYAQVVKLKPDMVTIDGDPVNIPLKEFREGVWVFKRGGRYYFTWSIDDARSPDYRVGWGVSDSPLGPVKSQDDGFIVLRQNGNAVGTAHHSVLNVPGTDRWYCCYHRHAVPGGSGFKRQVCLTPMTFDANGNIRPMDPLTPAFPIGSKGEPLTDGKGRPDVK